MSAFVSIDQNSHPLWDTLPKLHALEGKNLQGLHLLEDIDVAFTRRGASPGDEQLDIVPERYYRGGTSDWGATLFYTCFLGRNPLDVRDLEPYTGLSTKALAHQLETTVDGLYDRYSPSDNWQMVGSSYVDESREAHRVIGDLTLGETGEHIFALLDLASNDLLETFPEAGPRERIQSFFQRENSRLKNVMADFPPHQPLVDLYRHWMQAHTDSICYGLTSEFFSLARSGSANDPLLKLFLNDYSTAAALYNEAVAESDFGLNKLSVKTGEMPFFLVWKKDHAFYRTPLCLDGHSLSASQWSRPLKASSRGYELPLEEMAADGIFGIAGKALLLVLQARLQPGGYTLALPYRGSSYMPAARSFERKLREAGHLAAPAHPVCRVKLNFLESLQHSKTIIRLPDYLQQTFGVSEIPARQFADQIPGALAETRQSLAEARTENGRQALMARLDPKLNIQISELETKQRELARNPETRPLASDVWNQVKQLRQQQMQRFVEFIVARLHTQELDYFNSRGAAYPWSLAVGGEAHYEQLISRAEIYEE